MERSATLSLIARAIRPLIVAKGVRTRKIGRRVERTVIVIVPIDRETFRTTYTAALRGCHESIV